MTLVDLPGLTRNPVGDQSETIVHDIKEMVEGFIKNPNCIILAVSPAIDDIANSEATRVLVITIYGRITLDSTPCQRVESSPGC